MNRLVIIGNGFDLAHGLKTSYADFIHWYWDKRVERLSKEIRSVLQDPLCTFVAPDDYQWASLVAAHHQFDYRHTSAENIIKNISTSKGFEMYYVPFLDRISKSVATRKWVDIENEYYGLLKVYALSVVRNPYSETVVQLNEQLHYLQSKLMTYLGEVEGQNTETITGIKDAIYAPIKVTDVSVTDQQYIMEHIDKWKQLSEDEIERRLELYGLDVAKMQYNVWTFRQEYAERQPDYMYQYPDAYLLPDSVMFLNFNYTSTAHRYLANHSNCFDNHIHGDIRELDEREVIFGYGDEIDEDFTKLQNLNDNECLRNVKSIRYLESSHYRNALAFIESGPFQVYIMGHSCGNSDRTLLNTIFEHNNCISIKPYYHVKDNGVDDYIEIIQNISRNFKNRELMRARVVNKTLCEPMPQGRNVNRQIL